MKIDLKQILRREKIRIKKRDDMKEQNDYEKNQENKLFDKLNSHLINMFIE